MKRREFFGGVAGTLLAGWSTAPADCACVPFPSQRSIALLSEAFQRWAHTSKSLI